MTGFAVLALWLADGDVSELVDRLSEDSVEAREAAAAELVRRGDGVRAVLEKVRSENSDAEVRGRIDDILARLERERRRREFAGGAVVDGLACRLRVQEDRWTRELRLTLEVMNVAADSRTLAVVSTWNAWLPGAISSSGASQAGLVALQVSGERPPRMSFRTESGGEQVGVLLQPGESRTFERAIPLKDLPAGDYVFHVDYYARKLLGTSADLRSNPAFFKVR